MSYQSCVLDGLFVLRWGETPEVPDVARYCAEMHGARIAQGKPLVGLFIMPTNSRPPDDVFRKAQAALLPEIMSQLSYAVAVFEGVGFLSSLKRSALAAILLLAPKRHAIYVRSTLEEALLSDPAGPLEFDVKRAFSELHRRGLVTNSNAVTEPVAARR